MENSFNKSRVSANVRLILHIPHSSTAIPLSEGYILPQSELQKEIVQLTDWYTEDLFDSGGDVRVVTPFSRIFCDVERFSEDKLEVMSKYGMGALYEKTDDGRQMRIVPGELRQRILDEYYRPHHTKLENEVDDQLQKTGKALIIDCHSFPDTPMIRDLCQELPRPDINIGIDEYHTSPEMTNTAVEYFRSKGYSVLTDKPYSGTMVPLKHYRKDRNVMSIMVEINRKLYLAGENDKSGNYVKMKEEILGFLEVMRRVG